MIQRACPPQHVFSPLFIIYPLITITTIVHPCFHIISTIFSMITGLSRPEMKIWQVTGQLRRKNWRKKGSFPRSLRFPTRGLATQNHKCVLTWGELAWWCWPGWSCRISVWGNGRWGGTSLAAPGTGRGLPGKHFFLSFLYCKHSCSKTKHTSSGKG